MLKRVLLHLLLTLVWVALTGNFVVINFLFGYLLSYSIMWIIAKNTGDLKYFLRIPRIIAFFFYFLKELIKANLLVTFDVVTPKFYMTPGIVKIPLEAKTDLEITLLANLITLTPGTLALDVSDDKSVMYVHGMYVEDRDAFVKNIKNGFEKKLLEILR